MNIPNVDAFSYHIDALHLHGETHRRLISEHRLFEIRCARSPMSARALAAQHATCRLGVYGVWISCCLAVIADGLELLEPWSLEYHPERIPFPDPWVPYPHYPTAGAQMSPCSSLVPKRKPLEAWRTHKTHLRSSVLYFMLVHAIVIND